MSQNDKIGLFKFETLDHLSSLFKIGLEFEHLTQKNERRVSETRSAKTSTIVPHQVLGLHF
jgi:hypothetical protein